MALLSRPIKTKAAPIRRLFPLSQHGRGFAVERVTLAFVWRRPRRVAAVFVQLGRCVTACSEVAVCLQNLRVRTVGGTGLALSFGKLPGSLCSKYMLVDGEKVAFGSYRCVPARVLDRPSWSWTGRSPGLTRISVPLQLHLEFHPDGPEHRHRHVRADGGLL